jgi:hypothetical protein
MDNQKSSEGKGVDASKQGSSIGKDQSSSLNKGSNGSSASAGSSGSMSGGSSSSASPSTGFEHRRHGRQQQCGHDRQHRFERRHERFVERRRRLVGGLSGSSTAVRRAACRVRRARFEQRRRACNGLVVGHRRVWAARP